MAKHPLSGRHDERRSLVKCAGGTARVLSYRTEDGWVAVYEDGRGPSYIDLLRSVYGRGATRSAAVADWHEMVRAMVRD